MQIIENLTTQNKNAIMFITALCFMAGILSYFNDCAVLVSIILTVIVSGLCLKKYFPLRYIFLWAIVFYLGFFNASLKIKDTDEIQHFAPYDGVLTGRIVSIPTGNVKEKEKFFFNVFKVDDKPVKAKTLVTVEDKDGEFSNLKIGNVYKIKGKLRTPFKAGNPSQFDYGKYLKNYNTYTVTYADAKDCVLVPQKLPLKWNFLQKLNNVRSRIISTHALFLKSPNLEILGGIVFGDDAIAPPDYIKDTFKNSGLLHILAASGMNVAFIYGFWFFILRRLRVKRNLIIISGMGVIVIYTLMTGLGASVIRAALMFLFVLLGKLIDRDSHSVALLAFVASLMLIYNPAYINDVGFQLSFIVTFGLLTTANVVMAKIKEFKIPDWLLAELLIPIVAQLWVIPLQMFYFNNISTYSVPANIAIMPFLSVISFEGFVSSLLSVFAPIAKFVCMVFDFVLNICLNCLVAISNFFSNLPYTLLETTHPSVFQVFLYYVILLVITYAIYRVTNKKLYIVLASLVAILGLSCVNLPNKNLEIITFDVQNADAFLIKTPKNQYFIIDTGKSGYNGGTSQAKVIILKYLKDRGIKNIEGLILTHFDNDHSGGAVDIMENLNVKRVYLNSYADKSNTSKNIYNTLGKRNILSEIPQNSQPIFEEENLIIKNYTPHGKSDNENSLITLISYGNFDALFMGDGGIEAYEQVKKDIKISGDLEFFKVGHHGARGVVSDDMVKELNPKISVISTGKNFYGHPNITTLDTLRHSDVYRTDRVNSVKVEVRAKTYRVLAYNKTKRRYKVLKEYEIP